MKRLLLLWSLVLTAAAWLGYALLARPVAGFVAGAWGDRILQAGDGKFSDVPLFLTNRAWEAAWLWTLAGLGFWAVILAGGWAARRLPALWKWIPYAATAFLATNLWLKLAMATCLFWCCFWNGKGATHNLTQFRIKLLLMPETRAQTKVVLGGSSQVHAQIDPKLLNRQTGPAFAATELHFPGNHGNDFLFLDHALEGRQADMIVCYLSEMNFFAGSFSDGFPLFLKLGDVPELLRLGGKPRWAPRTVGYGLLGSVLPAFRLRDVFAQRFLGEEIAGLKQRRQITSLPADLRERADQAAKAYRLSPESDFEMAAFEAFVQHSRAKHRTVVLCAGQLHPLLAHRLDPALRPRMLEYLRRLAATYDNVVLLDEKDLPAQVESDYDDLTHVNAAAQARFTEAIGRALLTRGRGQDLAPAGKTP